MEEFKKLGLSDETIKVLEKKGYTEPTSIQAKAIPLLLKGKKDVVGQSQTGTGKTASFALPIIETIKESSKIVQAIILAPTRELALQVAGEINSLKGERNIKVLAVYGGAAITTQIQKLKKGIDIVVGTPGRVMDLQKRKNLNLDNIKYAVLDEADEMLNMGFVKDIEKILKNTPEDKKMLLFSATMPKPILNIAKKYMREYEFIEVEKTELVIDTVEQIYYDVNSRDRNEALKRVIDYNNDFYGIVFCNRKSDVDTLTHQLLNMNYSAAALHGDITQGQREKILGQFRKKQVKLLIATDVAARGIDIDDLTHVVNFSLPQSPESYVHRIGRTGRAGKKGIAITFVIPSERRKLSFVERINSCKLTKHKLPSAKDIVAHKEVQMKEIIKNIIEKNSVKSLEKYKLIAEELLEGNKPDEIIAAVLKYSFKNQLDLSTYKDISEVSRSSSSSDSRSYGRGRSRSSRGRSDRGEFRGNRSNSSSSRRSDRDRSSSRGSDRKRSDSRDKYAHKKSDGDRSSSRDKYAHKKSDGDRSSSRDKYAHKKSDSKKTYNRDSDKKKSDRSENKGSDRKRSSDKKNKKSEGFRHNRKVKN